MTTPNAPSSQSLVWESKMYPWLHLAPGAQPRDQLADQGGEVTMSHCPDKCHTCQTEVAEE